MILCILYLLRVGGGIGSCNSGIKRARLEEESGKGGMEGESEAPPAGVAPTSSLLPSLLRLSTRPPLLPHKPGNISPNF